MVHGKKCNNDYNNRHHHYHNDPDDDINIIAIILRKFHLNCGWKELNVNDLRSFAMLLKQ